MITSVWELLRQRDRIHDMCTAVNRVWLRRFTVLFNDNLSTVKVKLRNVDEKNSLGIKNYELNDNDFRISRRALTQFLHFIPKI